MPVTRLAPTPSGFLHAGNRLNFTITAQLAAEVGAALALRIDDADTARYRREYAEDIFVTLAEMGIEWAIGPRDVDDFEASWSQARKTDYYRAQLGAARDAGLPAYACTCTRTRQRGPATGGCAGGCRGRGRDHVPGETALRLAVDVGTVVSMGGRQVDLAQEMGDFVLWRRDDLPAYQLVSVIEDRDLGVTHIVRGEDLTASSAAQVHLAPWLGADTLARAVVVHHELLVDETGAKLSKSTLGRSAREDGRS